MGVLTSILLIPRGDLLEKPILKQCSLRFSQLIENANFLDIDNYVNHTCANSEMCVDGVSSYSCNCSAGYTGVRCTVDLSPVNATWFSCREIYFKVMTFVYLLIDGKW